MDLHENARTARHSRILISERLDAACSVAAVAHSLGVTPRIVRKWRNRFATEGVAGLVDISSRPQHSPSRLVAAAEAEIETLGHQRMTGPSIADVSAGQ